ncbi:MAG: hypothetical protein H6737_02655 [Alphaproteobacteria bacterium]|nr:hypothetical protein [Alphaproteobacteria bacterium]
MWPAPDDLIRSLGALCALDRRLHPDGPDRYARFAVPGGEAFHATNGGGDHAVLLHLGVGTLVRGFDHESDASPYMREPQAPDPALEAGLPDALRGALDLTVGPLEGFERTFVAWWDGDRWEHRGDGDFADLTLAPSAGDLGEWLEDLGWRASKKGLTSLLSGSVEADRLKVERVEAPVQDFPGGWRFGDPFTVTVSTVQSVSDIALLKRIREMSGGSIGEIKRALSDGGPLLTYVLQRHSYSQVERVGHIGELVAALAAHGGARLALEAPVQTALDEATFRAMLGPDTLWLSR